MTDRKDKCFRSDSTAVRNVNPLMCTLKPRNNSVISIHWALVGGHLVQRGGDGAGCSPTQSPHRCTKCNSPCTVPTNFILFDVAL